MQHLVIMADDLTGACDTAAQFLGRGLRPHLFLDPGEIRPGLKVVAADTDSRGRSPAEAYGRVKRAAQAAADAGYKEVYKKIDSTLRGQIGAEVDAVMDQVRFSLAAVCPAFPRMGRTTRDGIHRVGGVPVAQTEAARDPSTPVIESDLCALLRAQSGRRSGLIDLATLRAGRGGAETERLIRDGVELIVFDAETDGDLALVVRVMAGRRPLWVGSAGLAGQLPVTPGSAADIPLPHGARQVLMVAGSASAVTRAQVGRLEGVAVVRLDPSAIWSQGWEGEIDRCHQTLAGALSEGKDAVLCVAGSAAVVATDTGRTGVAPGEVAARIAAGLAEVAARGLPGSAVRGLVLTGGETARAVCSRLGLNQIELLGEVEPGVPLGRFTTRPSLFAVTKAGSFGSDETLLRSLRALKGER